MNIESNLKLINSGNAPTTSNLAAGEMAFGKITSDSSKVHLYVNDGTTVTDLQTIMRDGVVINGTNSTNVTISSTSIALTSTNGSIDVTTNGTQKFNYNGDEVATKTDVSDVSLLWELF